MTKTFRQLANLVAANWRTSLPPTGQPLPAGEDHPPTGEPRRRQLARFLKMTKSARQLARSLKMTKSNPPTGEPLPTGQILPPGPSAEEPPKAHPSRLASGVPWGPHRPSSAAINCLRRVIKGGPPTGEPGPSCSKIEEFKSPSPIRQLASWARRGNTPGPGPGKRPPPSPTVHTVPLQAPGAAGHVDGEVCCLTNLAKDRADAQRLVATRLLDRLHDPLGHFSRLQRIHPRAR